MRDQIEKRLLNILREELDWTGPSPAGRLDEHFDSLQLMSLVVAVEDHFEVILEPEDEETIETADDLVRVVEQKLEGTR